MISLKKGNIEGMVISVYLIFQIALDFVEKINVNLNLGAPPLHRYIKAVFILYISINVLIEIKNFYKNYLFICVAVLFCVFMFSRNYSEQRIEYLMQYGYFFMVSLFYLKHKINSLCLKRIIKTMIITNFVVIMVGIIFNESIFLTYNHTRFGYNGFILSQMQTTVFYLSSLAFCLYSKDKPLFLITFISSMLSGTKALLLGIPILIILFFIFDKRNKQILYFGIFTTLISFFGLIELFKTNIFKEILENEGYFTMFFSYRDKLFLSTFDNLQEDYSIFNFLIGGFDLSVYKTEFDFVDITLFLV